MEKQNLRGEELALARTLAREFATKYNRRRGVVPPDVPQEVETHYGISSAMRQTTR